MNRRRTVVASGALLALFGGLLGGGAAQADPGGAPTFRVLSGVGSDTTQDVMNAMANTVTIGGTKVLGSYNALIAGDSGFDSKDPASLPAGATTCHYAANTGTNAAGVRPNGSGAGRARLLESLTAGDPRNGCLDFSRSSSLDQSAATTQLTYIPFALDGIAYAVRSDSTINRRLSLNSLKLIYQCDPSTTANFLPLLPQSGSGTRAFWLATLGLTEATKGACVKDTWDNDSNPATPEVPIEEHDGRPLLDKKNLAPFSAAQWAAQSIGVITDVRGKAVLGGIAGVPALGVNGGGAATRKVYNVVPTSRVGNASFPELNQVFVGPSALICQQTATIGTYGFGTIADCGDTTKTTP
jgi:ABC-type phosphate transport system substrate-binding protein